MSSGTCPTGGTSRCRHSGEDDQTARGKLRFGATTDRILNTRPPRETVMSTDAATTREREPVTVGALARRGVVAVALAVAVNAVVVFAADAAGIAPGLEELSLESVVPLTVLGVLGATAVYGLLSRFAADPDRRFVQVAAVVLVLSVIPDFTYVPGLPGATLAGAATLAFMHVTTAVVAILALTRRYGPRLGERG